jgi:hypothetical protein
MGITSDNVTPIHLCETLELVNKKLVSEYLLVIYELVIKCNPPVFLGVCNLWVGMISLSTCCS